MIKLSKNERVDWFRITVDLANHGISIYALSSMAEIPRSTIQSWRDRQATPKVEAAFEIINIWADITGKELEELPVYNPFLPDAHPQQPKY
jgi:hypothetical protein